MGGGGGMEVTFYHYKKGGVVKALAMHKWGHNKFLGRFIGGT